ncbi:GNAT family protein [Clostridium sp.]|uniref:GNAT family N-acetyltransferase n=1 Tax=Clostridium sp. TaxID=1506 RepID=UPI0032166D92
MNKICEGRKVYLRSIELEDAELIVNWKSDNLVRKMSVGLNTEINYENQYEDIKISIDEGEEIYLIIVLSDTDESIGYIRINWMDNSRRIAWLRFGLGSHRGEGYAKDGLESIINHLFSYGVHRIDAEVLKFNYPSQGVLRSLGFKHEGTRRDAYYEGTEYSDVLIFGLIG